VGLRGAGGHYLLAAGQNRGDLKIFETRAPSRQLPLLPTDRAALVTLKDGRVRREEFHFGESFLSQSGRSILWNPSILSVAIIGEDGKKRVIAR
jgi:hypothetical protein